MAGCSDMNIALNSHIVSMDAHSSASVGTFGVLIPEPAINLPRVFSISVQNYRPQDVPSFGSPLHI